MITYHQPAPTPALWDRKWSSSDVLYGPSRLGRNQDVLLGAGMIVSALAGRFVSLQVISWMDNDRYTFPAIFHFCRRGSDKHRTLWPWGHLHKQESRLLKLAELQTSRDKDTISQPATRPRSDPVTSDCRWVWGLVSVGFKSGRWRVDDEEILRKPLLISDAFDELWWIEGRGGWKGYGLAGGGGGRGCDEEWGGCDGVWQDSRGHSFDLWIFNFF